MSRAGRSAKTAFRPAAKVILGSPIHFLAFGFGSGLSPIAPGTAGTLAALPVWWLLSGLPWPLYLAVTLLFLCAGGYAFHKLNIEAYPDPSPPMMEIITQSSGQSAEEVERYITIPLEIAMAGMPGRMIP